jgi:hypothetical protein
MSVPLYVRGLAEDGKDGPFHHLEAQLKAKHQLSTSVTGKYAAELLSRLAAKSQKPPQTFPIPFQCANEIRAHLECCGRNCDHDKQCYNNESMWRTIDKQKRAPYVCELSDGLAQHLIDFYASDTEELRTKLTATLQSHGDIILDKWQKMSEVKRGMLLARVSPDAFGPWPLKMINCHTEGCFEEHFEFWNCGPWMNLRDMAGDW